MFSCDFFIRGPKELLSLAVDTVQSDQNMMIPALSGIHMNFQFEVSSYSAQNVREI